MDFENNNKVRRRYRSCGVGVVFVLSLMILIISVHLSEASGNDQVTRNNDEIETKASERKAATIIYAVRALFSLPKDSDRWAFKAKDFLRGRGRNYIAPPDIDFRDGGGGQEGAAEKVKEAVVRSLDKGKETVEGSAKSAAKFAVEKLKKTLPGQGTARTDDETEL